MKFFGCLLLSIAGFSCEFSTPTKSQPELAPNKKSSVQIEEIKSSKEQKKDVPSIEPIISDFPNLNPDVIKKRLAEQQEFDALIKTSIPYDKMTAKQKEMVGNELYYMAGPFATQEEGCSWYCAGGVFNISATSTLDLDKNDQYEPNNLHDFDLQTAWVEGKENYGIGEKIDFVFRMSPGLNVTNLIIYNGYCKSEQLWLDNSRVKTFGLYVNGILTSKLSLKDTYKGQSFDIGSYHCTKENDLVLTLEILDIYPGKKYPDVAISEINFDGTGDH